ncbi:MAG: CBS domain-containing protein [archaeon]
MRKYLFFFLSILLIHICHAETAYYGHILIKDSPYQGAEISATWMDDTGKFHISRTTTLTRSQADRLNSPELTGYYFFTKDDLAPKKDTNVIFGFTGLPYNLIAPSDKLPYRMPAISFMYPGSGEAQEKTTKPEPNLPTLNELEDLMLVNESYIPIIDHIIENYSVPVTTVNYQNESRFAPLQQKKTINQPSNQIKELASIIFVIFALGGIAGFIYIVIRYGGSYVASVALTISSLRNNKVRNILDKPIKSIVSNIIGVDSNSKIQSALQFLPTTGSSELYVSRNGEYYGTVAIALLSSYAGTYEKKLSETDLIEKTDSADSALSLENAYYLMKDRNASQICVSENNRIIGILSIENIRRFIQNRMPALKQSLPSVRDILIDAPITESGDKVEKIIEKLGIYPYIVIVMDKSVPVGIVTQMDYIRCLAKYGVHLTRMDVSSIMSSPLKIIDPDIDIFSANRFMIEKEYRNYPVIVNDTLLGLLTEQRLCEEMLYVLRDIATK